MAGIVERGHHLPGPLSTISPAGKPACSAV